MITNPKHATSNYWLFYPYLEKVDKSKGVCSFLSTRHNEPVLVIENRCTIVFSIRIYRIYYEGSKNKEAEFVVDYYRQMIFPLSFFSANQNEDIHCKIFHSTLNNEIADKLLWLWGNELSIHGYTVNKSNKQTNSDKQPMSVNPLNSDFPRRGSTVNKNDYTVDKSKSEYYSREISFDDPDHTLYICKGTIACRKKNHVILPATGILVSLDQTPVKINVNYCEMCKKYFLTLSEYKYYQKIYGNLLGNYAFEDAVVSDGNSFDGLAEKSVLNLCGYNVNMEEHLSTKDRRLILANIMDHNIVSKPKVIEYLTLFIASKKNMKNMKPAVQKWTADLEWVRQYKINNQRKFLISDLKKYR